MSEAELAAAVACLEETFRRIHRERMADLPMVNPALAVQAVGFAPWLEGVALGVLVTPWFMNLMLIPLGAIRWDELAPGSKRRHAFPSGVYEFTVGDEAQIGRYQLCSLFSPMFQFADQEGAVATAHEVLRALMIEENHDADAGTRAGEIERAWHGEAQEADAPVADEEGPKAISRRDLLRGRLRGSSERGDEVS